MSESNYQSSIVLVSQPKKGGVWHGKPRPSTQSEEVRRMAVMEILPAVLEYRSKQDDANGAVVADLLSALDEDSYRFAERLDRRHGWSVSAELVGILDGCDLDDALNTCVGEWIQQNGVSALFENGARVFLPANWLNANGFFREPIHTRMEGYLKRAAYQKGSYVVCVPDAGHVLEGSGLHGRILPWEVVEDVAETS